MTFTDVVILAVVAVVLFLIIFFNVKAKRKSKCVGCPYAKACARAVACNGCKEKCEKTCGKC